MSEPETKSESTKKSFNELLRDIIKNPNEKKITKLWNYWKKHEKDEISFCVSPFSPGEVEDISSSLQRRVKEGNDIASVTICALLAGHDSCMAASLAKRGLAAPLMEIVGSCRDQADLVDRGLFAIAFLANDAVFVKELFDLGLVSVLEIIFESHSDQFDVIWAASTVCQRLAVFGEWRSKGVVD